LVLVLALMSVKGVANLQHQRSIIGEFSNYPLEEVVNWINEKTPPSKCAQMMLCLMSLLRFGRRRVCWAHANHGVHQALHSSPHCQSSPLRRRPTQGSNSQNLYYV
jgi:hypothetical protein